MYTCASVCEIVQDISIRDRTVVILACLHYHLEHGICKTTLGICK